MPWTHSYRHRPGVKCLPLCGTVHKWVVTPRGNRLVAVFMIPEFHWEPSAGMRLLQTWYRCDFSVHTVLCDTRCSRFLFNNNKKNPTLLHNTSFPVGLERWLLLTLCGSLQRLCFVVFDRVLFNKEMHKIKTDCFSPLQTSGNAVSNSSSQFHTIRSG